VIDLARAELRRENARLVLGGLWWIADPLLQMAVYTFLVTVLFARPQPDYAAFILPALIAWKGIATTISTGCTAVTGNERIVRQLSFPRIVLPAARVGSQLWRLAVALVVLVAVVLLFWPERVSLSLLWLPVLAVIQALLLLPFVIVLSAATVFLRDLPNFVRHVMRLAMYVSPVLYSLDQLTDRVPAGLAVLYQVNPVALLVEAYRSAVYYGVAPSATALLLPLGTAFLLMPWALAWFGRVERSLGKAL
jgi:ABC-type polysaccharide/polyol phosphate export permease